MDTQQIANRLTQLCEEGNFILAQQELYGEEVISIEPYETQDYAKETKGRDAVMEKIKKFTANIETSYGNKVSQPLITGNAIAFIFSMDIAMKGKKRMLMEEICVYEVKDGKIISEQFFM